ncbi:unnamed protein product [Closterium sp. Naga37s-1]|nr:unnamed protein product [Closterium sp. Naga37s-1]
MDSRGLSGRRGVGGSPHAANASQSTALRPSSGSPARSASPSRSGVSSAIPGASLVTSSTSASGDPRRGGGGGGGSGSSSPVLRHAARGPSFKSQQPRRDSRRNPLLQFGLQCLTTSAAILLFALLFTADAIISTILSSPRSTSPGSSSLSVVSDPFGSVHVAVGDGSGTRRRAAEYEKEAYQNLPASGGGKGGNGEGGSVRGGAEKQAGSARGGVAEAGGRAEVRWRAERLRVQWSGPPMGEEVQQRVAAATAVVADERKRLNAQPFQLHILVRAECGKGLKALLQSLQDVKYGEDEVQLTVATTCSAAARSAQEFPWFHGPRRVIELSGNSAKPTDPLPLWFPASPREFLLLLDPSSRVSPGLYPVLKALALAPAAAGNPAAFTVEASVGGFYGGYGGEGVGDGAGEKGGGERSSSSSSGGGGDSSGGDSNGSDSNGSDSSEEESTGAHVSGLFGIALDPDSPFLAEDSPIMTGFKRPEETLIGGAASGAGAAAGGAGRAAGRAAAGGAGGEAPGVGVLSLAMARSCQVVFPQPWRQFWAWHALSQAQQVNSAHLKFDWDAYDFSAPCREVNWGDISPPQPQQVNSAHLKFDWDAYDLSAPCRDGDMGGVWGGVWSRKGKSAVDVTLSQAQQVNSAHLKFDWDAYDLSAPCRDGDMGGVWGGAWSRKGKSAVDVTLSQAQQVNSAHLKFDWDAYDLSAPCRDGDMGGVWGGAWSRKGKSAVDVTLSQAQQVNSAHLKFDWDAYDFSAPCREGESGGGAWAGTPCREGETGRSSRSGGSKRGSRRGSRGGGNGGGSRGGGAVAGDGSFVLGGVSTAVAAVLGVARAVAVPAGQLRPPQVRLGGKAGKVRRWEGSKSVSELPDIRTWMRDAGVWTCKAGKVRDAGVWTCKAGKVRDAGVWTCKAGKVRDAGVWTCKAGKVRDAGVWTCKAGKVRDAGVWTCKAGKVRDAGVWTCKAGKVRDAGVWTCKAGKVRDAGVWTCKAGKVGFENSHLSPSKTQATHPFHPPLPHIFSFSHHHPTFPSIIPPIFPSSHPCFHPPLPPTLLPYKPFHASLLCFFPPPTHFHPFPCISASRPIPNPLSPTQPLPHPSHAHHHILLPSHLHP